MAEQRMKIRHTAVTGSCEREDNNQSQKSESGGLSQPRAGANPSIIHPGQRSCERDTKQQMRKVNWITAQPVQLMGVQRRKQVSRDPSRCQSFKGTSKKVA